MRLVCDNCSASYTIEDELVGDRDFRVSCKQCGTPIVVKQSRAHTSSSTFAQTTEGPGLGSRQLSPRPPRPPASFAPTGDEAWFVLIDGAQKGPYRAHEVADLIEQGQMDWGTKVWREGFRDWRVARRDATLVTAVAGAKAVGDTMRLDAARTLVAPEDTLVEARPNVLLTTGSQRVSAAAQDELLQSTSDTQAIDERDLPEALRQERAAHKPPGAWNSPENAAFRAALGLPNDTQKLRSRAGSTPKSGPTFADTYRTASSPVRTGPVSEARAQHEGADDSEAWVPKPQSLFAVASIAFAGGVLVAAIASRFIAKPEEPVTSEPVVKAARSARDESAGPPPARTEALPATTPAAKPPEPVTTPPVLAPARELPEPHELRGAVRRIAPDVKRCLVDPKAGVEVALFIDGASGRTRDVNVRTVELAPARVECVIEAVRQIQLEPFARDEVKLEHRFMW